MSRDRDKMINKIQALYAKASNTDFPEEADAFIAKANQLRVEWAVIEAELMMSEKGGTTKPRLRIFSVEHHGDMRWVSMNLFSACAKFCDVKIGMYKGYEIHVVGFDSDLVILDTMFTNLLSQMANTIMPRWDSTKSEGENLYIMRNAGYSWRQVYGYRYPDEPWQRSRAVRFTRVVGKYAKENDLELNKTASSGTYREQFVAAYSSRISYRLQALKQEDTMSSSTALVLANRDSMVDETLWEHFPDLKPHDPDCDCDKCHTCTDPSCQRTRCVSLRTVRPYRGQVSAVKFNHLAQSAGRQSADRADLGQTRIPTKKEQLTQ